MVPHVKTVATVLFQGSGSEQPNCEDRGFEVSAGSSTEGGAEVEEQSKCPRISKSDDSLDYYENIPRLLEIDAQVQQNWQASGKKAQRCKYGCSTQELLLIKDDTLPLAFTSASREQTICTPGWLQAIPGNAAATAP